MIKLVFIFSSLFTLNTMGVSNGNTDEINTSTCESQYIDVSNVEVYEIKETVKPDFNTKDYLSENCNPLKEKIDIDWCLVELFEIEEPVELGFNTKDYLPENFNPLKEKVDIDWSLVELFEIEEPVELGFNTKDYLPKNFSPCNGMS